MGNQDPAERLGMSLDDRASHPDPAYDKALAYAKDLGEKAGKNAAEWFVQDAFGGRTTGDPRPAAERVLDGINEGDPEVLDDLPHADLSGEMADALSGPQLVAEAWDSVAGYVGDPRADDLSDAARATARAAERARDALIAETFSDVCDAYEAAFGSAVEAEVARQAREVLK